MRDFLYKRKIRRITAVCMTLMMGLGLLCTSSINRNTKAAEEIVYYDPLSEKADKLESCSEYTEITSDMTSFTDGWYVLKSDVSMTKDTTVNKQISGDVNIILSDGATWSNGVDSILEVTSGTVTFYGQANQTGALNIEHATNGRGALKLSGGNCTINGGSFKMYGDWNGTAAVSGSGYFVLNYGNVDLEGTNSNALSAKTVVNGGTLTLLNGSAAGAATVSAGFEYNGGKVIAQALEDKTYYAFNNVPTLAGGALVKAGTNASDAETINASERGTYFTTSKYISIEECINHNATNGITCDYCGDSKVANANISLLSPMAGFDLPSEVDIEAVGFISEKSNITWKDSSNTVKTKAEANETYTASFDIKMENNYYADSDFAVTVNDKAATISEIEGGYRVTYTFAAVEKYDVDISFDTYETSYEYGTTGITITAKPSIAGDTLTAVQKTEILKDLEINYSVPAGSIIDIDNATGEVTIKNVGTVQITAGITETELFNSNSVNTENITIVAKDMSDADITITGGATKPYTGFAWNPVITIKDGDYVLVENTDYTVVKPTDMTYTGEKEIEVTYKGVYTGSNTVTAEITANYNVKVLPQDSGIGMTISDSDGAANQSGITAAMETVIYNADEDHYFPEDYADSVTYKLLKGTNVETSNSTTSGIKVERVSASQIKISGTPKYNVNVSIPAPTEKYEWALEFGTNNYTYGDTDKTFSVSVEEADGAAYRETPEITYASSDTSVAEVDENTGKIIIKKAGSFSVTVTVGAGDMHFEKSVTSDEITINVLDISETAVVEITDGAIHPYSDLAWKPVISVVNNGVVLKENTDYMVTYPDSMISVGEKLIAIQFKGNYTGKTTVKGEITRSYSVMVSPQTNSVGQTGMVISEDGGKATQKELTGKMETVKYEAMEGYYFPADYVSGVVYALSQGGEIIDSTSLECGVSVNRVSNTAIEVSGIPELLTIVKLPPATEKMDWNISFGGNNLTYGDVEKKVNLAVTEKNMEEPTEEYVVYYYSSNPEVASIDKESGIITIHKLGSFEIIVEIPESDKHNAISETSETYNVVSLDISELATISIVGGNSIYYMNAAWNPSVEVIYNSQTLLEGIDYIVLFPEDMTSIGTKTFVVNFIGNYTGEKTLFAEILEEEKTEEKTEEPEYIIPEFIMPEEPFSISGTMGKNDYYTTVVVITPAEGYSITDSLDKEFSESIEYTNSIDSGTVYLLQQDNGAISQAIAIPELLIDIIAPVANNLEDEAIYYAKEYKTTVTDKNLTEVIVNGEKLEIKDGSADITLESKSGFEKYEISAEDIAGNVIKLMVTVADDWMREGIVPSEIFINLKTDYSYKLSEGIWEVEGDDTQYMGGGNFYIKDEGEYKFKQVE